MSARVQDAPLLVDARHVDAQQFLQDIHFRVEIEVFAAEDPGTAEGGASDHHGIHSIFVERLVRLFERMDVAVAR